MLMGPEEGVGGDDTTEQSSEEEGGDMSGEEEETGSEASQAEQEGSETVAQALRGLRSLGPEEQAAAVVTVKRSLADSRAVSMSTQSVVVAEAVSKRSKKEQDRRLQGGAAGSPTLGMQNVGGGDTTKQGGAEAGGDSVEAVVPGTEAEAEVGQGMMSGGLEEEVGGDDTVEESGAEGESCDLEAAVQRNKVQEATGWDFTVQVRNMHREWERRGWAGWKEGQTGRYWAQGHEGPCGTRSGWRG